MRFFHVFLSCSVLGGLAASALSQGGQGGLQGSVGQGDETRATHILSPGDTAVWPIKAKQGEVIIARVSSRVFDPAIEIVDEQGRVLAENDDVRPGLQDGLILARLPAEGDYKIQVKAYKGGSGGQYEVHFTRFVPDDAALSARTSGTAGQASYKWLRFPAVKGQTYSFSANSSSQGLSVQLVNPAGEVQQAAPLGGASGPRAAFRADHTGDHYLRLNGSSGFSYWATISPARALRIAVNGGETLQLPVGGLDLWTVDVKAGDILRIRATARGASVATKVSAAPTDGAQTVETEAAFVEVSTPAKSESEETILIRRDGQLEIQAFQPLSLGTGYKLEVLSEDAAIEGEAQGRLSVGDADIYSFEAKAGDLVDLSVLAEDFDATLRLLGPRGQVIAGNDDGAGGRNARLIVALPEAGHYLVAVSSFGQGGGGSYRLNRKAAAVRSLAKGSQSEGSLGAGTADIWTFSGRAGQTVVISAQSEEMDVEVSILAPDGTVVARGDDEIGTNALASFELPLDGSYTIWVRGAGSGRYKVRWLDLND